MSKPSILVVDHDENVRNSLALILKQSGYQVTLAANANDALDAILKQHLDLLCLDIILPDMDVQTFLTRTREEDPEIQILVITANPGITMILNPSNCHNLSFFLKPVDPGLLLERISQVFHNRPRPTHLTGVGF